MAMPRGVLIRTASAESVSLQHPAPGLESLQGAYVKNVERLEQSAEEMSQGGSDIGEEIRRMKHEQDRASRQSSIVSREGRERQQGIPAVLGRNSNTNTTRSRNHSTSSYANSIVDVNTAARWGGYSPGGYVTSPSVSRVSSFHRPSGMPEPVQEGRPLDSPLASPTAYPSPVRQPSHYSLAPTNEESFDFDGTPALGHEDEDEHDGEHGLEHEDEDGHDNNKTPEPYHEEWERVSGQSNQEEEEEETSHYSTSHYSQSMRYSNEEAREQQQQQQQQLDTYEQHFGNLAAPHDPQAYSRHFSYNAGQDDNEHHNDPYCPATPPDRPQTADTYRQTRSLFKDFDGVHFSPTTEEFVELDASGNEVSRMAPQEFKQQVQNRGSQHRMSRGPRPMSYAQPPPGENMVYYPAPVPRLLNLPKRLSQQPAANQQAKRRSELLRTYPAQARQSAPWLPALDFEQPPESDENHGEQSQPQSPQNVPLSSPQRQRRSMMDPQLNRMSMANLPPQLRASVFFDQSGTPQTSQHANVTNKSGSAVAALDSILAASVNAPVNVFVDHPFAGNVSRDVYAQEKPNKRRSTALKSNNPTEDKRRSTTLANPNKSTTDLTPKQEQNGHERAVSTGTIEAKPAMKKRHSVMSILTDMGKSDGKKLKKRNSKMSLMTDLDVGDAADKQKSRSTSRQDILDTESTGEGALEPEEAGDEDEDYNDEDNDEQDMNMPFRAEPTTLLAELQTRKAHLKSRNRTAADSFPNGMHSTLLQLDAVAQIEQRKKQTKRARLAWEDPGLAEAEHMREEEDEDVPLGVLYPGKEGLVSKTKGGQSDWDRPLGLMAKREMEDNEPLSSRRFRLKGVPPAEAARIRHEQERLRREAGLPSPEAVPLPGDAETPDPDEPLAHRLRRLRQKEALNSALGDVGDADQGKSGFADDILSSIGGFGGEIKHVNTTSATIDAVAPEPEEETLGQRRARLQREREQQNGPKQRDSDPPSLRTVRAPLHTSPSLANLLAAHPAAGPNGSRGSSKPAPGTLLADARAEEELRKKLRERSNARSTSYNLLNGGLPSSNTMASLQAPGPAGGYYPQPQPPVMYPAHMAAGGAGVNTQHGYNPYMQPAWAGGYGYPGTVQQAVPTNTATYAAMAQWQGSGNLQDPDMDAAQRDLIDRWRLSIMH